MLVLFGNGVVANVVLARTKGNEGGWLLINAGWGVAVYVGAFCANEFSGAHLNPAVSVAMAVAGKMAIDRIRDQSRPRFGAAFDSRDPADPRQAG